MTISGVPARDRNIGGIPCIGGEAGGQLTLWVDATNAHPIRLNMPTKSSTSFSEYSQFKEPKAPPAGQVVDGKVSRRMRVSFSAL